MEARRIATVWPALVLGLFSGCAGSADRYTPEPTLARASLSAALAAWQDGSPTESIAGSPAIQWVDTSRQPNQQLRGFEILSEQPISAQGRLFVVRLALDKPAAEQRVRYVVVGIDPIWIFHKDDYDRLAHWEHPMEPSKPIEAGASGGDLVPQQTIPPKSAPPAGSAQLPADTHARY